MTKTFHELDFLGAAVSLLRRTHGSPGGKSGDGHRFKLATAVRTTALLFTWSIAFCVNANADGCASKYSPRMDFPVAVRHRDGSFMALLLSSAPTRGARGWLRGQIDVVFAILFAASCCERSRLQQWLEGRSLWLAP